MTWLLDQILQKNLITFVEFGIFGKKFTGTYLSDTDDNKMSSIFDKFYYLITKVKLAISNFIWMNWRLKWNINVKVYFGLRTLNLPFRFSYWTRSVKKRSRVFGISISFVVENFLQFTNLKCQNIINIFFNKALS